MHAAWVVDIRLNFDITRTTLLWTCGCNIFFNAEICAFPSRARASWYLRYKLAPKVELSKSHKTWTQQDLFILSKEKKLSCLGQYMPESQIDPCWACFGSLRNRVLPVPLGVASHHKQRAMLQKERMLLLRSIDFAPLSSSLSRSRSGW